jgi:hypothetical protein
MQIYYSIISCIFQEIVAKNITLYPIFSCVSDANPKGAMVKEACFLTRKTCLLKSRGKIYSKKFPLPWF